MSTKNRIATATNPFQGDAPRTLCVCAAGLLRSPTVAWVLSNDPWNHNTRAAGIEETFALIPVDKVLIAWADHIVCVEPSIMDRLLEKFPEETKEVSLIVLNIPDEFNFKDPQLVAEIHNQLNFAIPKD